MIVLVRNIIFIGLFFSGATYAGSNADPVLFAANIDQLEWRDLGGDDTLYFDGQASLGSNYHKFIVKAEVEREHGVTEEVEIQVLYSTPISTYCDIQLSVRKDVEPKPSRQWAVIAFDGLAPYFLM